MQLRGSALLLESEIWKFRTRSGDYLLGKGKDSAESNLPEKMLHGELEKVQQHISKAGSVSDTGALLPLVLLLLPSQQLENQLKLHTQVLNKW